MKKILFISFNRSEFSLIKPLLKQIVKKKNLDFRFMITGVHFDKSFGKTIDEIKKFKLPNCIKTNPKKKLNKTSDFKEVIFKTEKLILKYKPNFLFLAGDRHELLLIAHVALINNLPIIHYGGGQLTSGSWDNRVRYALTSLSKYHFVSTKLCKRKLLDIGVDKSKIFVSGSIGLENILQNKIKSKKYLKKIYNFNFEEKYFVSTIHPNTLKPKQTKKEIKIFLKSLSKIKKYKFLITSPNNDTGYLIINKIIKIYLKKFPKKFKYIPSFGNDNYISALKWSCGSIGNSSSGIIETASLGIPNINVGDRQKNRYRNVNNIDVEFNEKLISQAIKKSQSKFFLKKIENIDNVYYKPKTSSFIINAIKNLK